jgi:hypothetical protein
MPLLAQFPAFVVLTAMVHHHAAGGVKKQHHRDKHGTSIVFVPLCGLSSLGLSILTPFLALREFAPR